MSSSFVASGQNHPRPPSAPRVLLLALIICTCWHLFARPAGAQPPTSLSGYVSKRWSTSDGLPHNSISTIAQTRDGYLWIGTINGGLVRFDGLTFRTFDVLNTPGFPSNTVLALYEAADGTLWVGTGAGLARYREGTFTAERLGADALDNWIVDIGADRSGQMWVAARGLVARREGERWLPIPHGEALVTSLLIARDGALWIGTSTGLIEWRDRVVRVLTTRERLPADFILALREDRAGRLWIGTSAGLAYIDRSDAGTPVRRDLLSDVPVTALFEDSRGVLWIGGIGRLFARAASGHLAESPIGIDKEADLGRVGFIMEDREGAIWFGVREGTGGLHRLGRKRVSVLSREDGLPCNNVGPITQAADGTIWLATHCQDGRGVVAIRNGRPTLHAGPPHAESLLAEPDGALWVGTFDGTLFRFEAGRFVEYPTPTSATGDSVAVLYRHQDGSLWLGTIRGLAVHRGGQWTRIRTSEGLVDDDVRAIAFGGGGSLWIGTNGGLSFYENGRFTNYTTADGLPPGPVRAIHVDAQGIVWLGTYGGGLARFKDGAFTAFGLMGGVLDTSVHRILEDEAGFLWLTGDRGIRRVSKRDLNDLADGRSVVPAVRVYDEADGMTSAECNGMAQPAGWRTRDGVFHFPTQAGVVAIDPAATGQTPPALLPHVEGVVVDRTLHPPAPSLSIAAGYRDVEVRYTAPAFVRPEQVQFRYRLDGHDKEWIEAGTRRVAHYANLPPGSYRFVVTARRSGGSWQEQPTTVALLLQPHWYERMPFQIGLVAVAGIVVAGLVRGRMASLERHALRLERAVADRTSELSVAQERLLTAKQAVEQAHDQVLTVLNQLDTGALMLDEAGTVRFASVSAQRLLNKDATTLVGKPWAVCLPLFESDRAQIKARLTSPETTGERVPVQMVLNGTRYWMEIDVRDNPRPETGRILYLHNATEITALPGPGARREEPHGIIGRSTAMHMVFRQIRDLARVDATVLIEGETGTGKELVARAIHRGSRRADKPFIAINAAGLTESILASQLFGHRRGAFTGALADQVGVFEAAHGGTLFLDEIGDISPNIQVSLLRVLQEREIMRIGEAHARRIDLRVLAATHRDLTREVAEGRFREDLLYRIRVASISVPALRDRLDDLPLLVDAFLTEAARQSGGAIPQISREAMDALMCHAWPGNVRELKSAIERAALAASDNVIRLEDLPSDIRRPQPQPAEAPPLVPENVPELDRLMEALRKAGGNRTEAARLLGLSRSTFYRRLRAHGLDPDGEGPITHR